MEKEEYKRFSDRVSAMTVFCAILVVMIHAYNVGSFGITGGIVYWIEELIAHNLARMAVPFFFLTSAFFQFSKPRTCGAVYRQKALSLLVPYLAWNCLYMLASILIGVFTDFPSGMRDFSASHILAAIFLYKHNYTFWYMFQLITLNLLYPVFDFVLKKSKLLACALTGLTAVLYFIFGDFMEEASFPWLRLSVLLYFSVGALLGRYCRDAVVRDTYRIGRKWLIILPTAVAAVLMVFFNLYKEGFGERLKVPAIFCMIVAVFEAFGYRNNNRPGKLRSHTFLIYAMHPLIIVVLGEVVYLTLPHTPIVALAGYIILPTVTVALIYGLIWLCKKLMPPVYRVLNGFRP